MFNLLAGDGLKPSTFGKRISFDGASRTVIDGPFAEMREIEIRPLFEEEDLGDLIPLEAAAIRDGIGKRPTNR